MCKGKGSSEPFKKKYVPGGTALTGTIKELWTFLGIAFWGFGET